MTEDLDPIPDVPEDEGDHTDEDETDAVVPEDER